MTFCLLISKLFLGLELDGLKTETSGIGSGVHRLGFAELSLIKVALMEFEELIHWIQIVLLRAQNNFSKHI